MREGSPTMALLIEKKEVFCRARYKQRTIALEECVPNPYHPACQDCDSPNIELLKEDDLKHFRKGKTQQRKAGQGRKKGQRLPEKVEEDDEPFDGEDGDELQDEEILYVEDIEENGYYDEDDHEY